MEPNCSNCRFWKWDEYGIDYREGSWPADRVGWMEGWCRRRPPIPTADGDRFPRVNAITWCGDHEPVERGDVPAQPLEDN